MRSPIRRTIAWQSSLTLALFASLTMPGAAQGVTSPSDILTHALDGNVEELKAALPGLRDPALRAIADMILAAGELNDRRVRNALTRYLATRDGDPHRNAVAWSVAANSAFTAGDYATATKDADHWIHWLPPAESNQATDAANVRSTAALLAKAPTQRVEIRSPKRIPTQRDPAGLLRADADLNGRDVSVVLDTGANVSTISKSAALRLGIHVIEGSASVGSGTRDSVKTSVGYASTIELAGVTLTNVAFLVLDDDQLAIPIAGYKLDVIIGFPVFQAMQRIRFTQDGFEPFPPAHSRRFDTSLYFSGSSAFVGTSIDGRRAYLQLDSGAPASSLAAGFTARNPDSVSALPRQSSRTSSAGGMSDQVEVLLPHPFIKIGTCVARLPALAADLGQPSAHASDGTLGQDIVSQFDEYTLDFKRAKLSLEGKTCS